VDEQHAETLLNRAAAGKEELRVVRWLDDKHREADAKEIMTYLLETSAHFTGQETFPVYEVETYALSGSGSRNFRLPAIDRPIGASFDSLIRLEAVYVRATVTPGDWLPVALTFMPLAPMDTDYKVSLRLTGPAGERVSQKDRTLRHNFHQGTSLWPAEAVNEYYLLSVPSALGPGDYTVTVLIYHPETLAPLTADGLVEVTLGQVRVE
jgi:hypothetical protein